MYERKKQDASQAFDVKTAVGRYLGQTLSGKEESTPSRLRLDVQVESRRQLITSA